MDAVSRGMTTPARKSAGMVLPGAGASVMLNHVVSGLQELTYHNSIICTGIKLSSTASGPHRHELP
jgi:hypothetical protein